MRVFLFISLIVWASQLRAEVTVRSGEHENFSRLVFTLPSEMVWSVQKEENAAIVRVGDRSQTFDGSEVFDRIPKTRLSDLKQDAPGGLKLILGCDCSITSFQFGSRAFVIDIADEKRTGEASIFDETDLNLPIYKEKNSGSSGVQETGKAHLTVPPLGFQNVVVPEQDTRQITEELSAAREKFLKEISRAATKGLVTPRSSITHASQTAPVDEVSTENSAAIKFDVENMIVGPSTQAGENQISLFGPTACLGDRALDIDTWSNGVGFQRELGNLRKEVFSDLQRIESMNALSLVKLYLSFGFGAEALSILQLDASLSADHPELLALGEVLEFGTAQTLNPFKGQEGCDGLSSLWSILASASLDPGTEINGPAILRSANALPPHLRKYLGPQLSEKLRLAGHSDLAKDLMRIVQRGNVLPDPAEVMETSQFDLADGKFQEVIPKLTEVYEANAEPSPKALVQLIDANIQNGTEIDPDIAPLAASFAFELRETELGPDLERANILALADSGQFLEAVSTLDTITAGADEEAVRTTRDLVFQLLAQRASDTEFLVGTMMGLKTQNYNFSPGTRQRVANRLLNLGVTDHVEKLLDQSLSEPQSEENRILNARLSLLEGQPRRAISQLLGIETEEAMMLNAHAFEALGETTVADNLRNAHDAGSQTQNAFLARDWEKLAGGDDTVLSELATSRLTPRQDTQATNTLKRSRDVLEATDAKREAIGQLLDTFRFEANS